MFPSITRKLGGLLLVVAAVAACSGSSPTPSATPITDPQTIIAQSLTKVESAHSFHVSGTIAGTVDMAALMRVSGQSIPLSGTLDLKGGTIAGDVDAVRSAAHLTVTFPSLFGLSIDLIAVDGYSYTKVNLTGDKYTRRKTDVSAAESALPGSSAKPADVIAQVATLLQTSGATAAFAGHGKVEGRDSLRVDLAITPENLAADLQAFVPGASGISLDSASGTYFVYADTLQPAQLDIKGTSATLGNVEVVVTLTKYGQDVTIAAPPAKDVAES